MMPFNKDKSLVFNSITDLLSAQYIDTGVHLLHENGRGLRSSFQKGAVLTLFVEIASFLIVHTFWSLQSTIYIALSRPAYLSTDRKAKPLDAYKCHDLYVAELHIPPFFFEGILHREPTAAGCYVWSFKSSA